jgi:hypothetical protein
MPIRTKLNKIDKYYRTWAKCSTVLSEHWCDENRFYAFIKSIIRYTRSKSKYSSIWLADKLRKDNFNEDFIERHIHKYEVIRHYLDAPFYREEYK